MNRSTAGELADEAFQSAIVPVAKLVAEHITRDVFAKLLGWREFEFTFNALETRDEQQEVAMQIQLLNAGVLSVAEVRAMRGLPVDAGDRGGRLKLTIDNLDGLGAVDYSGAIDHSAPLKIVRTLNAPSIAQGVLCLEGSDTGGAGAAGAGGDERSEQGTVLFTGYLATEPVAEYAGVASEGAVYRLAFSAVSDEWLLDKQSGRKPVGVGLGDAGGDVLQRLVSPAGCGRDYYDGAGEAGARWGCLCRRRGDLVSACGGGGGVGLWGVPGAERRL